MRLKNVSDRLYIGQDPWARRGLHEAPGSTFDVSEQKGAMLLALFPGDFEVVGEEPAPGTDPAPAAAPAAAPVPPLGGRRRRRGTA